MELDAKLSASAEAAKIMREMQVQLMSFVEAEEALCASAEGEVHADIKGTVDTLTAACDDTVEVKPHPAPTLNPHTPSPHPLPSPSPRPTPHPWPNPSP